MFATKPTNAFIRLSSTLATETLTLTANKPTETGWTSLSICDITKIQGERLAGILSRDGAANGGRAYQLLR